MQKKQHSTFNIQRRTSKAIDARVLLRRWMLNVECWMFFLGVGAPMSGMAVDASKLPPPSTKTIDFSTDIQPILENSCFRCHGAQKPRSDFSLISREAALRGGDNGVDIISGDSAKSPLIHYVAGLVEDMEMPPLGKGQKLTAEQIGLLRAWIDQGAQWGTKVELVETSVQPAFSVAPSVRWIGVSGDKHKFREHFWTKDGFNPGLEEFSITEKVNERDTVHANGHVFPLDHDYRVELSYDRKDLGFARGGFEQFRKYYDDSGGYYPLFTPPVFALGRDLHLDIGRAWAEVGLDNADWPKVVLGYEYQYRQGTKSTLQWGAVKSTSAPLLTPGVTRNIYPASKDIDEKVHVIRLDASHDIAGVDLADNFRAEFYDLNTHRENALSFTPGQPSPTRSAIIEEGQNQTTLANAFKLEKEIREWWFASAGYLYSHADADATFQEDTVHATGLPIGGDFWNSQALILDQDAHVFNLNSRFGPWNDFTLSLGAQAELSHQEGVGRVSFDTGNPAIALTINPATLDANLDRQNIRETAGLRYTGIKYTSLFADAHLQQEDFGEFESQLGGDHEFLRDTDATINAHDVKGGFYTSPVTWASFGAHYRHNQKKTDYDHNIDESTPGFPNPGYPAFFHFREIETDEVEAKLTLRPVNWFKTSLTYQHISTDFDASTDAVGPTPGGPIHSADVDADVYGLQAVFTPFARWYLSGTFTYYKTQMGAAHNDVPSVAPYRGDIYNVLASATYLFNAATDLNLSYSFSRADYGQDNFAAGLPVGITYDLHSLQAGVTRRFKHFNAHLVYGFYNYSEPTSGGFNDYTAHAVFATMVFNWR